MKMRKLAMAVMFAALQALSTASFAQPSAAPKGKLERITVHAPTLVGNLAGDSPDRKVSIYLPASYSREAQRRYPVIYLLHGYTDSDERWFGLAGPHFINVPLAADRAFVKGAREAIIVMPNAFNKYQGSMYSSSAVIGDWETFVTRDLVAYVDKKYRTIARRDARGLAGHSMGGYGTLRLGMKHPNIFSSLYALSPCCMTANLQPSAEIMERAAKINTADEIKAADFPTKAMLASAAAWSPNPSKAPNFLEFPVANGKPVPDVVAQWAANAPLAMIHQYIPNLKTYDAIVVDAGDKDVGIAETVRTLDRVLSSYGITHTSEIYEGDHVNRVEQRFETKVLPFFSERLKQK